MEPAPKLRLPFKGPIFVYALFAAGLASSARLVERHFTVFQGVSELQESALRLGHERGGLGGHGGLAVGRGADLEAQLAPFMPLAGLPLPGGEEAQGGPLVVPAGALAGNGPARSFTPGEELPRWTYLMNAEQRRDHRGPSARHASLEMGVLSSPIGAVGHGAPPTARPFRFDFQLLNSSGRPLEVEAVQVIQRGSDGEQHPSAYPSREGAARWIGGSEALTPGSCALFVIEAIASDGVVWSGSTLGRAPLRGGVSLGAVTLGAVTRSPAVD